MMRPLFGRTGERAVEQWQVQLGTSDGESKTKQEIAAPRANLLASDGADRRP